MEMTNVEPIGRITPRCQGLYNEDNERALARVVAFCKQHGTAPFCVQLAHAGRKASTAPPWQGRRYLAAGEGGWTPVAPSPVAGAADGVVPRQLLLDEVQHLPSLFVQAAQRALRAGVDAIELHAAHGYLLHQFLSPLSNQRADAYGGTLEKRLRLVLEVFEAVRGVWPHDLPVGVRVSATDWVDGGWDLEHSVVLCRQLAELGCDWFDVSSGGLVKDQVLQTGPGYQVPFAERIKRETGVTTMAVDMITEPDQAEGILREGRADLVAMARGLLYEPHWMWRAAHELGATARYPDQYLRARPDVVQQPAR